MGLELSIHPPQPVGSGGTNASGVVENFHIPRSVVFELGAVFSFGKLGKCMYRLRIYTYMYDYSYTGIFHVFC